jgi:hypothetical protein
MRWIPDSGGTTASTKTRKDPVPIPAAITEVASPTESSVTSTPDSTDSALEPDAADEPYFPIANGVNVVQLTDTEGVGRRPLLAWEPAEGAAGYTIVVFDGDNSPYWAALTSETEIYIGGSTQIPEGNDGPIISEGYQWVVYADDADGVPIGSSPATSDLP